MQTPNGVRREMQELILSTISRRVFLGTRSASPFLRTRLKNNMILAVAGNSSLNRPDNPMIKRIRSTCSRHEFPQVTECGGFSRGVVRLCETFALCYSIRAGCFQQLIHRLGRGQYPFLCPYLHSPQLYNLRDKPGNESILNPLRYNLLRILVFYHIICI